MRKKHKCSAIRTSQRTSSRKKWRRRLPPYRNSCRGSSARPALRPHKRPPRFKLQIDEGGQHFQLQPYDWNYYADQVRKAKYNVDDNDIRPYFELNNVLQNGLFYAANQLYGITFKERHDIPVWQPDVRVFEVFDKNGASLALMYFDFFKRDNKQGGAWMNSFTVYSTLLGTKPVVYNVENIPKGPPGQPTLLTIDSVQGMFHEFGHALNAFFADEKYPSLSGTARPRDFVEFPSQFNEHWALYPSVLKHYAFNYKTHEPMPQGLIDKMESAANFNEGYSMGESLAADELDMAWHSLPSSAPLQDVDAFETHALHASGTDFPNVPPRYRSTYFAHIWASGYAAGYYAYTWSEMLDDDVYQWFLDHGGLTRANGQRFRDMILSRGDSEDYGRMFRAFYGKDPDVRAVIAVPRLDYGRHITAKRPPSSEVVCGFGSLRSQRKDASAACTVGANRRRLAASVCRAVERPLYVDQASCYWQCSVRDAAKAVEHRLSAARGDAVDGSIAG